VLLVSAALAWVATASAAPFAVGRATHVSLQSTEVVHAGPSPSVDYGAAGVTAGSLASGSGLVIKATFDGSITGGRNAAAVESAINSVINVYQTLLKDRITVSILFRYSTTFADGTALPPGAESVSESTIYVLPWGMFVDALRADATSAHDATANFNLPGSALSTSMVPSSANGRAVGLDTPPGLSATGSVGAGGLYDGIVTFNSNVPFDFGQSLTAATFDAQRSAEHEIDEVLGLGSYLDTGGPDLRPEDMFSWSSAGVRNIMSSGTRYLSIDGGSTNLVGLNQSPGGDFGDWLSPACPEANPHVQNAFTCMGETAGVTGTSPEGIALDVIGYEIASTTPTTTRSSTTTTLPCGDAAEATAIEAAVDAQCDCAGAPDHSTFVRCASQVAKNAVKSGTLSKQCKRAVVACEARSTCGKPGFVTCCRTTVKGKTKCSIKRDAAHCKAPKHGTACPGQTSSCCDACGAGGCVAPSVAP